MAYPPQVSTNLMSIKPVLECLKSMHGVPLAEELVLGRKPQAIDFITPEDVEEVCAGVMSHVLACSSQRHAHQSACIQCAMCPEPGSWNMITSIGMGGKINITRAWIKGTGRVNRLRHGREGWEDGGTAV